MMSDRRGYSSKYSCRDARQYLQGRTYRRSQGMVGLDPIYFTMPCLATGLVSCLVWAAAPPKGPRPCELLALGSRGISVFDAKVPDGARIPAESET